MRTLIYCTAYSATPLGWSQRYRPWVDSIRRLGVADQILLLDDGSSSLPGWDDTCVSSGDAVADAAPPLGPDTPILHHFQHRLGRRSVFDFPGWYRSYVFGIRYAEQHGFDRVIHIESDAALLSGRARDYARDFRDGWIALWSDKYGFAESAIQFTAGEGLRRQSEFLRQDYDCLRDRIHEDILPFTGIERGLTGDRHGESSGLIARDQDFVCQTAIQREASYYWWRAEGEGYREGSDQGAPALTFAGSRNGEADAILGEGWGPAEVGHRWAIGHASTLTVPATPHAGDIALRLALTPFLYPVTLPLQRLDVLLNGDRIERYEISGTGTVGVMLPAGLLRRDGTDVITLVHPDAGSPSHYHRGTTDTRLLAFSLEQVEFAPFTSA